MATTAIWDVTDRLDRVIDYATNPQKTENLDFSSPDFRGLQNVLAYTQQDTKTEKQFYVTGINCDPTTACEQMSRTKLQFQKTDGILAFHGYQSFVPGEATPETAHAIGVKLAQELWGERFEVIVSTHLDKHHLHNHFVLNSVSFTDGKRYYDNNATYSLMRQTSDRLCREYSLSVIENPQKGKSRHYAEWKAEQEGKPTWRGLIREDVDKAISASMTFTQFIATLRKQGYEVKTGVKYMAVHPAGKERFVRLKTLGDDYTEEAIKQRILQNRAPKRPQALPEPKKKRYSIRGGASLKKVKKLTGLQALYFHYLYKMGILPKHRASNKRTHFLLREDIRHMEEITAQTKLLCTHRIENKEQLLTFRNSLEQEMAGLYDTRKSLYSRIRRCKDDEQMTTYKEQIAGLSKKLSLLRKEVKLCAGILSRSEEMKQKLLQVQQEEIQQRKEEKAYEQRSRRSGPNRQYES
ncbi:relaxase/mobilization nuclease domain-containing protein [Dehalobacter sp. 14DCB1]|uniref:relaxase/mobilization nuclease domain-containing protein n=1 Tax=Dehalobacter sp. 14DCB1 TaxID=2070227 RepID=UPI00074A673F|nr:relaxase/mobilization nuclease domain-containing protein [Dehalobacter sp. 14DCB1]KUK65801.1 MAG: Relaxase [Desulfotomaculum sp. 46_80]TCX48884.1 relaxase [Dehalobacter sp. 14DCB1]